MNNTTGAINDASMSTVSLIGLPKPCDQAISKSLAGSLSDYRPKTTSWAILSQIANPLVTLHLLHSTNYETILKIDQNAYNIYKLHFNVPQIFPNSHSTH